MISILEKVISKLSVMDFEIADINVYNIAFEHGSEVNYFKKGRTKFLLHYIISGERNYKINNTSFTLEENTVILIPNGTNYYTKIETETPCIGIGICFNIQNLNERENFIPQKIYFIKGNNEQKELFCLADKLFKEYPIHYLELKACIYKLLSLLSQQKPNEDYSVIKPAIDFLTEHYKENLPISVYANLCTLSESYFRKKFRENTGISPIEYRNRLRFAEARHLYQGNQNLQEIAEKVGFCDAGYFSKLYKKYYGTTLKKISL